MEKSAYGHGKLTSGGHGGVGRVRRVVLAGRGVYANYALWVSVWLWHRCSAGILLRFG